MTTSTFSPSLQRSNPPTEEPATAISIEPALPELPRTAASGFIVFALALGIVLTSLAFGTVHYWALFAFAAWGGVIVVAWSIDAFKTRVFRVSRNRLQWPLIGLFVIGLIQLLPLRAATQAGGVSGTLHALSLDPYATRLILIQIGALIIYFAAALAFIDSPKRLRRIVWVISIFGFALAFLGIIQSLISPTKIYGLLEPKYATPFGPYVNRHNFAGYLEMAVALPLGLLFSGAVERDKRLLYLTGIGLMGIAIILSQSRGGLISFIAEVMFLIAVTGFRSIKRGSEAEAGPSVALRAVLAGAMFLVVVVGVVLIGGESSLSRFSETKDSNDPTSSRTTIWRVTLDVIRAHPITGSGLGAYGVAYTPFDPRNGMARPEQSHNDYLQIIADAGIVGAILGAIFLFVLFKQGFARRQTDDSFRRGVATGALAGCFAVLVHSLFDFTLHTTSNALLFLILAALATINGRVEDPEAASKERRRRRRSVASVSTLEGAVRHHRPADVK
ncbi:MAG: O-antigen ligase family protein [Pyrinomonadaceae bacterium]